MIAKEVVENNKLIAEFHDPTWKDRIDISWENIEDYVPSYHKYWDYLMPVVEKIESLKPENNSNTRFQFIIKGKMCLVNDKFKIERDDFLNLHYKVHESKLLAVWFAIVEFLKWYNEKRDN